MLINAQTSIAFLTVSGFLSGFVTQDAIPLLTPSFHVYKLAF